MPDKFVKTIKDIHKEKGEKWLQDFESLCTECENRWHLKILSPFELSYNFVAPAELNDGRIVVLKLSIPSDEFLAEVEALKVFDGNGMAKLIDSDIEKGILILERLTPGETLAKVEDDVVAVRIASQIMKKLWKPANDSLTIQSIESRQKSLERIYRSNPEGLGVITFDLIQEAVILFNELLSTQTEAYLLHGDLHHYNILKAGPENWKAIDPKGLIGEREYDIIQFLLNNLENKDLLTVIEERIDVFVQELGLDKNRIISYGFSNAVLSTCWSVESHGEYNELFYESINIFKKLLERSNLY
ncbi:aminoglycoside phosphotransferase family protein [Bacillus sp. EAC]|uniref:aminoglycoside phosphotransferase family protein n=1 Tax=Bacillus sp. EAC TaxID=1978338 RepID=UPI0015C51226|nr:aminoglycoside phosphotransferase family protein [Bacillus sp. EAC]